MNRVCPIVLRQNYSQLELLAFKHPKGDSRFVKGKIKQGEQIESACVRELEEESGIQAQVVRQLGVWDPNFKDQVWGFYVMHYNGVQPDRWNFNANDDGGQIFRFYWQPLNKPLDDSWNAVYTNAFRYIKNALGK